MRLLLICCLLMPWLCAAAPIDAAKTSPAEDIFSGYPGTIIVHDLQTGGFSGLNESQWDVGTLPASTFKIPNSLIGLESGIIPDIDFMIPWDGVEREIKAWNQDHSLKSAFAASAVPYYQELARRVGYRQMSELLGQLDYGTMDLRAGNLDEFWLRGHSRITPREQVGFLARLVRRDLPFSKRSQDLVESIMLRETGKSYTYYGKSGWVMGEEPQIGWFVGFVRRGDKAWTFAARLIANKPDAARFGPAREAAAKAYLKQTGILTD